MQPQPHPGDHEWKKMMLEEKSVLLAGLAGKKTSNLKTSAPLPLQLHNISIGAFFLKYLTAPPPLTPT